MQNATYANVLDKVYTKEDRVAMTQGGKALVTVFTPLAAEDVALQQQQHVKDGATTNTTIHTIKATAKHAFRKHAALWTIEQLPQAMELVVTTTRRLLPKERTQELNLLQALQLAVEATKQLTSEDLETRRTPTQVHLRNAQAAVIRLETFGEDELSAHDCRDILAYLLPISASDTREMEKETVRALLRDLAKRIPLTGGNSASAHDQKPAAASLLE